MRRTFFEALGGLTHLYALTHVLGFHYSLLDRLRLTVLDG